MKKKPNEYEQLRKMLKTVRLIQEQNDPAYSNRVNTPDAPDENEQSREYDIAGQKLVMHSTSTQGLEPDENTKNSFQEMFDQFTQQVSGADITEFGPLHISEKYIKWSGKLVKYDVEFYFLLGEHTGLYLKGEMIKVDEDFTTILGQLSAYYKIFSEKWGPILTERQSPKEQ